MVDSITGISGAGRSLKNASMFCTVDEDVQAYGLLDHRHTPEIEQATGAQVLFTPHLAPMTRGILATCYARLERGMAATELVAHYREFYREAPFVRVVDAPPQTKHTLGSNLCLIHPRLDERSGRLVVVSCIDNLVKGAAGQAVQNMNLMLGLPETTGLDAPALYP